MKYDVSSLSRIRLTRARHYLPCSAQVYGNAAGIARNVGRGQSKWQPGFVARLLPDLLHVDRVAVRGQPTAGVPVRIAARETAEDRAGTLDGRSRFSKTGPAPYVQPIYTLVQKAIVDLEFDEISFSVGIGGH